MLEKDQTDLKGYEIKVNDRVKVKYGKGRLKRVYDAKVLRIESDGIEKRYYVHYNGWNHRFVCFLCIFVCVCVTT